MGHWYHAALVRLEQLATPQLLQSHATTLLTPLGEKTLMSGSRNSSCRGNSERSWRHARSRKHTHR